MKNKVKLFRIAALAAIVAFSMIACGDGADSDLNGTWVSKQTYNNQSYDIFLTFYKGVFQWDGEGGTYTTKKDQLTLVFEDGGYTESYTFTYKTSGKTLTLTGYGETMTFTKKEKK